jgi:predicted nucleic acid-binding protein
VQFVKAFQGAIGTTWPVITEVTHLLDFSVGKQLEFLKWVERGGVAVAEIETKGLAQIAGLMKKYADAPMDFADATLVFVADRTNTPQIMTLDDDFHIYRLRGNKAFESVL